MERDRPKDNVLLQRSTRQFKIYSGNGNKLSRSVFGRTEQYERFHTEFTANGSSDLQRFSVLQHIGAHVVADGENNKSND